jgi:phosphatidylglycerol lysyltransferase
MAEPRKAGIPSLLAVHRLGDGIVTITLGALANAIPLIAATLTFLGGLVLLISGTEPAVHGRLTILRTFLPLPFAEASHLLASLAGLLLLIVARGLLARMALARTAGIVLMVAGAAFSVLKALDWEDAATMLTVAAILAASGSAFYRRAERRSDWSALRPTPGWLALVMVVVAVLVFLGLYAFQNVAYRSDMWWDFSWHGDASRFLRATLAVAILAAAIALDALINRPRRSKAAAPTIPGAVRDLIGRSRSAQASIALLGDKQFMMADNQDAFIMYGVTGRSWIAMGDPVGEPEAGRDLIWRFAERVDRAGARPVFYAADEAWLSTYLDLGLSILKVGEVARVDLTDFSLASPQWAELRRADRRAAKEGIDFALVPKADVPPLLPALRAVSDAWLAGKAGHEKGFSLGFFDETYLAQCDLAVMRQDGAPVAFANLWRGAEHTELSPDLMRYRPNVSKVMMDALFARLMAQAADEGYRWFNLGATPLAGLSSHPLASTWNRFGTFVYRYAEGVYNFEGLRAYKQKFDPVWTPQYLACPGGLATLSVLFDLAALMSGGRLRILS